MKSASLLTERVAFDAPVGQKGLNGVTPEVWEQRLAAWAQFIYASGSEAVAAARLSGRSIFKVRIWNCRDAREISTNWRLRDVRRDLVYSIREIDTITDRDFIFLVVEGGKKP